MGILNFTVTGLRDWNTAGIEHLGYSGEGFGLFAKESMRRPLFFGRKGL